MSLDVHSIAEQVLSPGRFFAAPPHRLRMEHVASERLGWELFRGHLLDPAHARQQFCFAAWNVYLDTESATAPSPLLSLKWRRQRDLSCHAKHPDARLRSLRRVALRVRHRAAKKWVTELVGTVDTRQLPADAVIDELSKYVLMAVIGTSRLPIVSLDSPLPAYSLGELCYLGSLPAGSTPWTDSMALLAAVLERQRASRNGQSPGNRPTCDRRTRPAARGRHTVRSRSRGIDLGRLAIRLVSHDVQPRGLVALTICPADDRTAANAGSGRTSWLRTGVGHRQLHATSWRPAT